MSTPTPVKKVVKKVAAKKAGPSYLSMIVAAVTALKERGGSSRQAIKKFVAANNMSGVKSETAFMSNLRRAFTAGVKSGALLAVKGSFKCGAAPKKVKKVAKKAAPKAKKVAAADGTAVAAPKKAKKAAAKKAAPKKAGAKKAAPKKAGAKKAAPKKAAKMATKKAAPKKAKKAAVKKVAAPKA